MRVADMAKAAAEAAAMAGANLATIQTGSGTYDTNLKDANDAYDDAMEAYNTAKMESEAAQAITDVVAAVKAAVRAENAKADAEMTQEAAEEARDNAVEAAKSLLMIVDTLKSVGDVDLDASAPNQTVTKTTGGKSDTADTGLQDDRKPTQMVDAITGQAFSAAVAPAPDTPYRQAVAERTIDIGKVVDSADDTARLMIVTQYVGSKNAKVFAYAETDPAANSVVDKRTGTVPGKITLDDGVADNDDTNNTTLRSVGMFYLAGAAADSDGLANTDEVADGAKAFAVYSFVDHQQTADTADDETVYLVEDSQRTEGGTITYVYRSVDIMAPASDATSQGTAEEVQVTEKLAEAIEYDHIHLGIWANLEGPGNAQTIDGLGIGFVQSIGDGMTVEDDMPNHGDATFNGNWAATVQAADPDGNGAISLINGVATIIADFEDEEITATLRDLVVLSGEIAGNSFSGTEAAVHDRDATTPGVQNDSGLADDADLMGSFNGAFFGTRAAEVGGVFSFTSDDNEDGAVSGAFGGAR